MDGQNQGGKIRGGRPAGGDGLQRRAARLRAKFFRKKFQARIRDCPGPVPFPFSEGECAARRKITGERKRRGKLGAFSLTGSRLTREPLRINARLSKTLARPPKKPWAGAVRSVFPGKIGREKGTSAGLGSFPTEVPRTPESSIFPFGRPYRLTRGGAARRFGEPPQGGAAYCFCASRFR